MNAMTPRTQDNVIYLTVGVSIAVLLVAQDFYAESHHGRVIIDLSTFAVRAATSTLLVGYFVGREVRHAGATVVEVVLCVAGAGLLQLAISFGLRQYVGRLSSMSYVGLAALETLFLVNLATWAVSRRKAR